MLFGGMEALAYNNNRRTNNVKLFEFGKTYHNYPDGRAEKKHLALTISGNQEEDNWIGHSEKSDFFYAKGIITSILSRLGISDYSEKSVKSDIFSEGLSVVKNKKTLVDFGVVKKKITKAFAVEGEAIYADFNWDAVLEEIPSHNFNVAPIPKFPQVKRDFALLLDDTISFDVLKESALQTERELLKEVTLFDVYTGKSLPKGKKSYALSFTIQDEKKTLTDKQIDKIMKKLQQRFESDFGASLR
jgi:phenylalanyl-tRNA synthetase beta chain